MPGGAEFAPIMGPLAKHLFGEPNRAFSSANEWRYGARGSLSIDLTAGRWFDHEAGEGGGVLDLVERELKLSGPARLEWLKQHDFLYDTHEGNVGLPQVRPSIVATYDYRDENNMLLFQVVRFDPKDFRQRRLEGAGWTWSVKGVRRVPYRLPELLEAEDRVVFIVEGEKSVDWLRSLGIPATCSPGGANKWRPELSQFFVDSDVVIIPDHDQPGQDHAQAVAASRHGVAKRVRVLELWHDWPDMPPKADVYDWLQHGGTAEKLYALVDATPEWGELSAKQSLPVRFPYPIDEKLIPRRDWIVPGLLLRRHLSLFVAPPGSGKSLLTFQTAIAIAAGMDGWGGWRIRGSEKVLLINVEEDYDESLRRLAAAARHMGVDQNKLKDRLAVAEAPEKIVICRIDPRSRRVDEKVTVPLVDNICREIANLGVGVVVVDPFAETFDGDENSNSEAKWAGIAWREVARRTGVALWLVHHTRKYAVGMAGDQDAARGAGALVGTARIVSTLFTMTKEEAAVFNITEEQHTDFVRFDDAKSNYSRKVAVRYFKKDFITLDNADDDIPGDEVGVLQPWSPPGAFEGVEMQHVTLILDKIERGIPDDDGKLTGRLFAPAANSKNWVGLLFFAPLGLDEDDDDDRAKIKKMIKLWLENEVLRVTDFHDPKERRSKKGVEVVAANRPDQRPETVTL